MALAQAPGPHAVPARAPLGTLLRFAEIFCIYKFQCWQLCNGEEFGRKKNKGLCVRIEPCLFLCPAHHLCKHVGHWERLGALVVAQLTHASLFVPFGLFPFTENAEIFFPVVKKKKKMVHDTC